MKRLIFFFVLIQVSYVKGQLKVAPSSSGKWALYDNDRKKTSRDYDTVFSIETTGDVAAIYLGYLGKYKIIKKTQQSYTGEMLLSYLPHLQDGTADIINRKGILIQKDVSGIVMRLFYPVEGVYREPSTYSLFDTLHFELTTDTSDVLFIKNEGRWGAKSLSGKSLLPFVYENVEYNRDKSIIQVSEKGKKGIANFEGKMIVPVVYDSIRIITRLDSNVFIAKGTQSKVYSGNGTAMYNGPVEKIFFKSDYREKVAAGLVYKIEGRYYGALKKPNLNFNDLDPLADSVSKFKIIELLQISAEGDQGPSLYALENLFGERPDNKVYKSLEPVAHGYLAFIADSKGKDVYGFIDSKGRVVIPFEYSSIEYTSGIFIASKEGRFGAFNTEGKILIPFVHSFLLVEDEGNSIIGKTENKDVRYNKEGVRQ